VQCSATARRTGQRCTRLAIPGGAVCRWHGGAAPQVAEAARARSLADWGQAEAEAEDGGRQWADIVLDLVDTVDAVYRHEHQKWEDGGRQAGADALVSRASQLADLIVRAEKAGVLRRLEEQQERLATPAGKIVAQTIVAMVDLVVPSLTRDPVAADRLRVYLLEAGNYSLPSDAAPEAPPVSPGLRVVDDWAPKPAIALPAGPGWTRDEASVVWEALREVHGDSLRDVHGIVDGEVIDDENVWSGEGRSGTAGEGQESERDRGEDGPASTPPVDT
jgi:hypothetical protein